MANKWQLNNAKQIVYFDKNGSKRSAKEVWYVGRYNKYKIWPAALYLTNIKIVGGGKEYTYSIDNQGVPSYTYNGTAYAGLAPNVNYSVKGTVVSFNVDKNGNQTNKVSVDNCWPYHLTGGDHNDLINYSAIWSCTNSNDTKLNPITGEYDRYNVYKCDTRYYPSDDNNVWTSPHMGYLAWWKDENNGGYITINKLGESDYGVRLKRIPLSRRWNTDSNYITLGSGDSVTQPCTFVTSWEGPNSGSITTKSGFTITNDTNGKISANYNNGNITITCNTIESGQYTIGINSNVDGYASSISKTITVVGPLYRLFSASYVPDILPPGGTINIKETKYVTLYRAVSVDDITNNNYTQITNFTLSSSDTSVVEVSGVTLKPKKSGTAIITVTDPDYGSFTFTCVANVSATDSVYAVVNVLNPSYNNNIVTAGSGVISNGFDTTININNSHLQSGNWQIIMPSFYTSSSASTDCPVYVELIQGTVYGGFSNTTTSGMTLNIDNLNPQILKFNIYTDSSKSKKLGCLVLDYL